MRKLVWAATLGAIVSSANGSYAIACPSHQGADQFSSRILELTASVAAAKTAIQSAVDSWVSEAFFSDAAYESVSTMAGLHDAFVQSPWMMDADASSAVAIAAPAADVEVTASIAAPTAVDWDLDDWSALDVVPSPGDMGGLEDHGWVERADPTWSP